MPAQSNIATGGEPKSRSYEDFGKTNTLSETTTTHNHIICRFNDTTYCILHEGRKVDGELPYPNKIINPRIIESDPNVNKVIIDGVEQKFTEYETLPDELKGMLAEATNKKILHTR